MEAAPQYICFDIFTYVAVDGAYKVFESANYDDRNATAVSWYALGGWIDDTVYIKIGDCQFMLY